jgi:hypothetical protein
VADDDVLTGIERWAAEARAREAAEARVRERWLRTQAQEDARFAAVLAGLAERRGVARLATTAGREVQGRVSAVGQDFVALDGLGGRVTLVTVGALAWVRPADDDRQLREDGGGGGDDRGGLGAAGGAALVDVLAHAAATRPRVSVVAGSATITGELRAVGVDVLVLETAGEQAALVYIPLPAVTQISLLTSG